MDKTEFTEPIIPDYPRPDLVLGEEARHFLNIAGKWAIFLGILGFIGTGFMALIAVFASAFLPFFSHFGQMSQGIANGGSMLTIIPLLLILMLYFFMSYYLYQFGANIKNGITLNDSLLATKAFKNLKSHFKLIGITLIVIMAVYALVISGMIIGYVKR